MPKNISQDLRDQIYATEMSDVPLVILDIVSGATHLRFVNNNQDIIYDGNTYQATAFNFIPPGHTEGELESARLSICNIDRQIVAVIRTINTPPLVTANMVVVGDTVEREAGPWEFELRDVSYNAKVLSGTLVYNVHHKEILSTIRFTSENFPSLTAGV